MNEEIKQVKVYRQHFVDVFSRQGYIEVKAESLTEANELYSEENGKEIIIEDSEEWQDRMLVGELELVEEYELLKKVGK